MLTNLTIVEYAKLEISRDPEFLAFCESYLALLREKISNIPPLPECLDYEVAAGFPMAKVLLEAFSSQSTEPQWQRARRLSQGN